MSRKLNEGVKLNLRFSEGLRRRLEKEAARNDRSMNAEIIHRLEQSFAIPDLAGAISSAVIKKLNRSKA